MAISIQSTIKLRSGAKIPQLGYGVYQARGEECEKGVAEALKIGYTHVDSAQVYRNETCRCKVYITMSYISLYLMLTAFSGR
jgi:diketogulonate reductase-like aldo/keto reductase